MAAESVRLNDAATRIGLVRGMDKATDAVKTRLGRKARAAASRGSEAKAPAPRDRFEKLGADLARVVADKTAEAVGDGTATATVLAHAIITKALNGLGAGADPTHLQRGIQSAVDRVSLELTRQSKPVTTPEDVISAATVAAGDDVMGRAVGNAVRRVRDGAVLVEKAQSSEPDPEFISGIRLEHGFASPRFVTDVSRKRVVFDQPYMLVVDADVTSTGPLRSVLDQVATTGRPLALITRGIGQEALAALIADTIDGRLKCVAIAITGPLSRRSAVLRDLAAVVGATVVDRDSYRRGAKVRQEYLGGCNRIVITEAETVVVEGHGMPDKIAKRVNKIRSELNEPHASGARERLARLTSGAAVVKLERPTDQGSSTTPQDVESAVASARAAIQEGVVPGGGVALLNAANAALGDDQLRGDELTGATIVREALEAPLRQIALNAGLNGDLAVGRVQSMPSGHGLDVTSGLYVAMVDAGIVDSTKVVQTALRQAGKWAGLLLTTGSIGSAHVRPDEESDDTELGDIALPPDPPTHYGDGGGGNGEPDDDEPADGQPEGSPSTVDSQVINFWVREREQDPEIPLRVGTTYTGVFRVGEQMPFNLSEGEIEISRDKIPIDGLNTEWIVWSTTVALSTNGDDETANPVIAVTTTDTDDPPQWIATFPLIIPPSGDSEDRVLRIAPLTTREPRLEAMVMVGGDMYRRLTVRLQAIEPHSPASGPTTLSTRTIVEAVSVEERRCLPEAHTALRPSLQWQAHRQQLHLTLLPPHAVESSDSPTAGGDRINVNRTMLWTPSEDLIKQRIEECRKALDAFRSQHSEMLDLVEPGDVAAALTDFTPGADWSISSSKVDPVFEANWQSIRSSKELRTLADCGRGLMDALFPESSPVRESVGKLEPGDRLQITWHNGGSSWISHVPWTLGYTGRIPAAGEPIDPLGFLGMRLRIGYSAHSMEGSRSFGADVTKAHLLYWGGQPEDLTQREAQRHLAELTALGPMLVLPNGRDHDGFKRELCDFLAAPRPNPVGVLYLYCQCTAGTGARPTLRFGSTSADVDVLELVDIGRDVLPDQPLVFLNACDTAAATHFYSNELENRFFERGCRAYIGTECKVPIRFAARFATVFFHFFYGGSGDLTSGGEALTQARKFFWDRYRNLGGLFYSYVNDDKLFLASFEEVAALR